MQHTFEMESEEHKINPMLNETQKCQLKDLMHEFKDVFNDITGRTNLVEHKIDVGDAKPIRQRLYRIPWAQRDAVKRESDQNFLLRALNLREKILFTSKQEGSRVKCDEHQCQSMFLRDLETGLINRLRRFIQQPNITDAELIAQLNFSTSRKIRAECEVGTGLQRESYGLSDPRRGSRKNSTAENQSASKNKALSLQKAKE